MKRTGGVFRYQAVLDRSVQALLEQSVDVPHGVFSQPWIFRALRAVTAKVFSLLQKISDLFRSQLLQRYIPQAGEDVVFEEIPMSSVCGRAALLLVIDRLSVNDVLFQRHIPTSMHWRCRFRKATHGRPACFSIRLCR